MAERETTGTSLMERVTEAEDRGKRDMENRR